MNEENASVHEPGGGLDFQSDAPNTLAQAAGVVELVAELLELLFQHVDGGRERSVGGASGRHRSEEGRLGRRNGGGAREEEEGVAVAGRV